MGAESWEVRSESLSSFEVRGRKQIPLTIFYSSSLPADSHQLLGRPADSRWKSTLLLTYVYKRASLGCSWHSGRSFPQTSIDVSPSVKHPGTRNHIQHLTQDWTGQIQHWLLPQHHYGNRAAWRSLKTLSLTFSSVKIILNPVAFFIFF